MKDQPLCRKLIKLHNWSLILFLSYHYFISSSGTVAISTALEITTYYFRYNHHFLSLCEYQIITKTLNVS